MHPTRLVVTAACVGWLGVGGRVSAQTTASSPDARPWGRVSFYMDNSRIQNEGGASTTMSDFTSSVTYKSSDTERDGLEYGVDLRHSAYTVASRPARVSIYEGFVGARFSGGTRDLRVGHVWLNDLGGLGSLAGGVFEFRQPQPSQAEALRMRVGLFAGLEPNIFDAGYSDNVRKFGGYVAFDGQGARRHVVGLVMVRNASLTERTVVTTTNFLPLPRVFLYQAAEYDVRAPAGQGHQGLTYFFVSARGNANERVELQGTYNRGRSIDARGLSEDILAGRPVAQASVEGWSYESAGGRATVEVIPRIRIYAGLSVDKNSRDAAPTGRVIVGGHASNVASLGFDLTASDSLMGRPDGSYHSAYVSIGRQVDRNIYLSADYSTSLSVTQFSRSDGITVELRPHTSRFSATATINAGRSLSLLATLDRTSYDQGSDLRVMSGITYRIR